MGNFLQTKWGSYIKALLGIILAYMLANGGTLATLGLSAWLGAISASFLPFIIKWITGAEGGFWNTWYAGILKTFVTVGLAYVVEHGGFIGLNWGAMLNAGVVAVITVIVNSSNPADERYGVIK
jgi:hypothetical protein